jgi:cyanophycinase
VIGAGAVYVIDGAGVTYSSLSERNTDGVISVFDVRVHILGQGHWFNLNSRRPHFDEKATNGTAHA